MAFAAPLVASVGTFLGGTAGTLGAAGAAVSAVSAISGGNYQAAVAKNNARIAEENAERASLAAQQEAARSDREYAGLLATQLARQGASGISAGSRSSIASRALTRRVGGEAARDIYREGADAAQRLQQDAANFRAEAGRARTQGYLNAIGSLTGGTLDVLDRRSNTQSRNRSLVSRRDNRRFGASS